MPLRWFRFGKNEQEATAQEAPAVEEETPPEALEAEQVPEAAEAPETAKKKRRRGSRGGRGRKKPGANVEAASDASISKQPSEEPTRDKAEREPSERKPGRAPAERKSQRATRRRTPTRRAPLPSAKRELLISVDVGEQRVAVLEDDRVAEVYLERPERRRTGRLAPARRAGAHAAQGHRQEPRREEWRHHRADRRRGSLCRGCRA